ncbi:MAG: cyclic pyranopterin monophosphate synthase MoaC [Flammeovirgaceae bacterium]|nr:cyclic pyranopterin monophosphate synthase MoaC [Flammeovirgaceae bacterium]
MVDKNKPFSHLDASGNPQMVDVGAKKITLRVAKARSIVVVGDEIIAQFKDKDIQTKKGPVFQTAIIAGTMAAKKTSELIPLCHPLGLDNCKIKIAINPQSEIVIDCVTSLTAKTGVEMEALTGASVAALTVYDMCKAFSHDIVIKETKLIEKTGGKSDFKR